DTPVLPKSKSLPTRVSVHLDYDTLADRIGRPMPAHGGMNYVSVWDGEPEPLPPLVEVPESKNLGGGFVSRGVFTGPIHPDLIRHLACDAQIIPVVFNSEKVVLNQGRDVRDATAGQRLALIARDRGCAAPGCDSPAAWCHPHHIE